MEIGDVQKKDIVDHPENYTLLTTLDEGLSRHAVQPPRAGPIPPPPPPGSSSSSLVTTVHSVSGMWRKFKEEGGHLGKASHAVICEDGIREMVTFLSPRQTEDICSP